MGTIRRNGTSFIVWFLPSLLPLFFYGPHPVPAQLLASSDFQNNAPRRSHPALDLFSRVWDLQVFLQNKKIIQIYFRYQLKLRNLSLALKVTTVAWCISVMWAFKKLLSLSYGSVPLTTADLLKLRWRESWHLILHKE